MIISLATFQSERQTVSNLHYQLTLQVSVVVFVAAVVVVVVVAAAHLPTHLSFDLSICQPGRYVPSN